MNYTREEQLDIGKTIYNNEFNKSDITVKYSIHEGTARDCMRLYQDVNSLAPTNRILKEENTIKISVHSSELDLPEYESITKEERIKELVKSRINEERLKEGYEAKGAGADSTATIFDNWNMK